tara:strand:- start:813 stop:1193 length:381 start_codon:yes stop_codon:yes gene_type:complete
MAKVWVYGGQVYTSRETADAAVIVAQSRLEQNPTDWVIVKEVVTGANSVWTILPSKLTDSQINNLNPNKHYSVSPIYTGENFLGLRGSEASAKVLELRSDYANRMEVNTIYESLEPQNVSMATYVS